MKFSVHSARVSGTVNKQKSTFPRITPSSCNADYVGHFMNTNDKFAHRKNADGTFDSICLACYRTIATTAQESMLSVEEQSHVCVQHQPSPTKIDTHADCPPSK